MEIAGNAIALLNPNAIAFPKQPLKLNAIAIPNLFQRDRTPKSTAENKTRSLSPNSPQTRSHSQISRSKQARSHGKSKPQKCDR
ncbi:hypothetical protein OGM63_22430 [Plectonema radiosum NIES-515]|uniref:Uncharacterized protein n=1 Tax=Plectonema radiosum NIES-515 TaxID=2986073 RepID=A0ABT3B4S1_9CYAN|nr:hypothetical protein [Plectonema radiosum]MCV3216235.1 hypothetical protein [Plectonema radiosum NIES-515]